MRLPGGIFFLQFFPATSILRGDQKLTDKLHDIFNDKNDMDNVKSTIYIRHITRQIQ